MPVPSFVHLRLHSEYSVVDGTVRIDEAVAPPRRTACPRWRSRTCPTRSGSSSSTAPRAPPASSPSPAATSGSRTTASATLPFRAILLAADRAGYLRLCDWLSRAYRTNQHRGRAELRREWFDEGTDGLIALSGAPPRRRRRARCCRATPRPRERAASAWAARFPQRYYLEVQRAGHPDDDALVAATVALASELALAGGRHASRAVPRARGLPPARGARVHRGRPHPRRHAPAAPLHDGAVLHDAGARWRSASPTCREALANSVAIAQRCNLDDPARQESPAGVSDARRASRSTSTCATRPRRGSSVGWRAVSRTRELRDAQAPRVRRAPRLRDRDHRADGLRRLLPDRRRLHQLGEAQPRAGRARPRLGRGLARRVRARHHRPRSVALRAAVRALPQSRARVDAGLRHRLLPGRPRPRHRLRQAEVRRRLGVADRDVRHAGREGRRARRRPRARPAVSVRRRHRQAHSLPAGQARDARSGATASPSPT